MSDNALIEADAEVRARSTASCPLPGNHAYAGRERVGSEQPSSLVASERSECPGKITRASNMIFVNVHAPGPRPVSLRASQAPQRAQTATLTRACFRARSLCHAGYSAASAPLQNQFFPPWDAVQAEHVVPGIRHIIRQLGDELTELEKSVKPTWSGLIEPLERISDRMARSWGIVSHLKAVKDTPELRSAVEEVQGERVKLSLRMSQSRPLYEAFQALRDGDAWAGLSQAQQRIVESELRDFVLGGVALEGEVRRCDLPPVRYVQDAQPRR